MEFCNRVFYRSLLRTVLIFFAYGFFLLLAIALGFYVTTGPTTITWDDGYIQGRSLQILKYLGQIPGDRVTPSSPYSALWTLVMALSAHSLVGMIDDTVWVYHAITASYTFLSIFLLYALLRIAKYQRSTALLGASSLFANIRIVGSGLFLVKDAPVAVTWVNASILLFIMLRMFLNCAHRRIVIASVLAILMGIISIIPFLLRSPLLLLLPIAIFIVLGNAGFDCWKQKKIVWHHALYVLCIFLPAIILIYVFSPFLHQEDLVRSIGKLIRNISIFLHYQPLKGATLQYFGQFYKTNTLPYWYSLGWIPLSVTPLLFGTLIVGLTQLFNKRNWQGTFHSFLLAWLLGLSIITFVIFLTTNPVLYDDSRHILFFFPPVFLLGTLALDSLSKWAKYCLIIALSLTSIFAYYQWEQYSYMYISPLLHDSSIQDFEGEFGYVCIAKGLSQLPHFLPPKTTILVSGPTHITSQVSRRYSTLSAFHFLPHFDYIIHKHIDFNIVDLDKKTPFAALVMNSRKFRKDFEAVKEDVLQNQASVLWEKKLPSGDTACLLVLYDEIPK